MGSKAYEIAAQGCSGRITSSNATSLTNLRSIVSKASKKTLGWQSVSPLTSALAEALYRKNTTGPATSSVRVSACRLGRVFSNSGSV